MTLQRVDLVATAKERVGKQAFALNLNRVYDDVLIWITEKYPLLKNQLLTGTTVESQAYQSESFPPGYRQDFENEMMIVDGDVMDLIEPEVYFYLIGTEEDEVEITPSKYAVSLSDSRIYFKPTPDDAYAYKFYHTVTHPPAGRWVSFTSGGTTEIRPGDTVTGATSAATGVLSHVQLTSGTWAAGTAAGTFRFSTQTGTFSAENLNVGSSTNLATIASDSSNEDSFTHLLGYVFDESIIMGIMAEAFNLLNPPQPELSLFWRNKFEMSVMERAVKKVSKRPAVRPNIWNSSWNRLGRSWR